MSCTSHFADGISPRSGRGPRVERVVGPRLRPRGGPRPRPRPTQLSTRRTHAQHRWTAATVYGPAATARRVQRRPLLCRSRRRFPRPCASSRARRFLRPKAARDRAGTSRRKRKRRGGRRRPHTAYSARRRRPALQPRGTFDSAARCFVCRSVDLHLLGRRRPTAAHAPPGLRTAQGLLASSSVSRSRACRTGICRRRRRSGSSACARACPAAARASRRRPSASAAAAP